MEAASVSSSASTIPIQSGRRQQRTTSVDTVERHSCRWDGCTSTFSRKADVARHIKSTHDVKMLDCPKNRCNRVGDNGFARQDHLVEHLRGFHREDLPKKSVRRSHK